MCMQSRLPLNSLNTFAAAAERLSFQAAAEALFVTPSAVSHQIRHLEGLLGYKLFERLDKRIRLSARGERLYEDIRQPIAQLQEAGRKALRGVDDNTLAISVAPMFATGWLLPRLREFHRDHSDINLSVVVATELVNFGSDPFDAAIRMGAGLWQDLNVQHLFDSEIVAVCRPSLLKDRETLLSPEEIADSELIQNTFIPGLWNEWFSAAGITMNKKQRMQVGVQGSAQVIEAVQSSDAFGLIDKNFIDNDIESGRLKIASDYVLHSEQAYYLTYPDVSVGLPALQRFESWLQEQIEAASLG